MTFSIPEPLARRLLRQVPSRQRCQYVAEAIRQRLRRREAEPVRACRIANEDPEVAAIEREMDALKDHAEGSWDEVPSRSGTC